MLVEPAKLNEILKVVNQLPVGLSLEIDKICNYYRIAKVHAIAVKNVIRLIAEILLQSTKSQFELFNVKPLPYYDKTLAQFVVVNSDSVCLVVSKSRENYVMLCYEQLFRCVRSPYGICPLSVPLVSASAVPSPETMRRVIDCPARTSGKLP